MKIRKIVLSIAIVLLILVKVKAQDFTNYNLYLQNPVLYNPAYALDENKLRAYVNSHLQWVGFDGAPKVNSFGIFGNFVQNMGFGLTVYNKQQGITSNTNISLDYAYRANIGEKHYITFGIAAGYLIDVIKVGDITNANLADQTIGLSSYNQNTFAAQAGLVYYYRSLEAQIVLPQLFQRNKGNNYTVLGLTYDYTMNPLWDLKPALLLRTASTTPTQFETSIMLTYKKLISGHVGYRSNKSYIFGLGLNWNSFTVGYAWQQETDFVSSAVRGTNEIQLIYRFGGASKNVVPKDNSLVSLGAKSDEDIKKQNAADSAKMEEQKKLDEAKRLADAKRMEEQKKFEDETLQEQKKIEDQMNKLLKKVEDLERANLQNDANNPENLVLKEGDTYKLGYIGFETGKNTLTKDAFGVLDRYAAALKKDPSFNVQISGYTDNTGSDATNNALSKARAQSCLNYLESRGISASRLKSNGYGSAHPVAPNTSIENKAKNRRVELKITK